MKKSIQYGVANYEEIIEKNGYFVDKTEYIPKLERVNNPVFLRPRRFGKSLWCRILECYYNIRQKNDFERLFGDTYIGRHPTPMRNACFAVRFDFSTVEPYHTIQKIEADFNDMCNSRIWSAVTRNRTWLGDAVMIDEKASCASNLRRLMDHIDAGDLPPLYIIIDEYDNFANHLIVSRKNRLYHELMADHGFLKTFFKTLKEGRGTGTIANVFITGVLPITMDELASGFNIASFITLDPEFESMLGFTQTETDALVDTVYRDYALDPATRNQVNAVIKNQYNGYHFALTTGEPLYNSTLLAYFLSWLSRHKCMPEYLIDVNLKTELPWVRRITGAHPDGTKKFVDALTTQNRIAYSKNYLISKFNMSQFFEAGFFPISFFYLGMLTRADDFYLRLPNLNMRRIFVEYFNELYRIDVATRYSDMMQQFLSDLNLTSLFTGYWEQYVSQLPEAVFAQMNENFYRTTFFDLCSQYLSKWFVWHVERSYPSGKTDLEFVGKFNEKFAGVRMVIEFKYYSNTAFAKLKTTIDDFALQTDDTQQIAGYVKGLKKEYPEATISQHVIYCFGNRGFKVFDVA